LLVNDHLRDDTTEPSRQRAVPANVCAEAFIEAHAADPITLEAIAAAARAGAYSPRWIPPFP
jgi:hypothetical protein